MEMINIRKETRRRIKDETPEMQLKSFDNRRMAKISEEASKRQDEPSEEFRIARKERISWRLKITEEKSEEDQMTKQVEETWNHLTIK